MTAKDDVLENADNPKEFFAQLYAVWVEDRHSEQLGDLIVEINNFDRLNVCNLACEAISQGFGVFDAMHILEDAIPRLIMEPKDLIALMESLYEGSKNDLAGHLQYKPINDLVQNQRSFAEELLDELLKRDRPFIAGYIANIFRSLSAEDEHAIHKRLEVLSAHESIYVVQAVINVLGGLNYKPKKNRTLLKKSHAIFDALETRGQEEIDACIVNAYGRLLDQGFRAVQKLIRHSNKNNATIDYAISSILFTNTEKYGDTDWFKKLLMSLTRTRMSHKGILDYIDFVLSNLVQKKQNWALAESFFIEWIIASDYKSQNERLSHTLNSTFTAFIQQRENLEKLITKLLNHDNYKAHYAASELVDYCNLQKIQPLRLDKEELSQLEITDLMYIGRKILGYLIDSKTQCSLTFSLLDTSPRSLDIQSLVYSIFVNHIGEDYPGSSVEYLEQEIANTKAKNKRGLAKRIIDHIEEQQSARADLPRIQEIIPSNQQTRQIQLEKNKSMSASMEEVQKGSISSLFRKIPLKYGGGSFSYQDSDYMQVSKLSSFSTSMELPTSEISHPVHAAMERAGFRLAKRGS